MQYFKRKGVVLHCCNDTFTQENNLNPELLLKHMFQKGQIVAYCLF